jgi:hypothetical protein
LEHRVLAEREFARQHHYKDMAPTDEMVAAAYNAAADGLRKPGIGWFASQENRNKFVVEGLRNLDETGIDQGQFPTCGNTCGEKYIAARNPDLYMDGLRQLMQTGEYHTNYGVALNYATGQWNREGDGGRALRIDLTPDQEASRWDYKRDGQPYQLGNWIYTQDNTRNWASEAWQKLFQANAWESVRRGTMPDQPTNGLTFRHVEEFTARVTGTPMSTIGQSAALPSMANIPRQLDDNLAMQLRKEGKYPAMVFRAQHWQTINNAYVDNRGAVEVFSDNQWGRARDRGWETVPQLHWELAQPPGV